MTETIVRDERFYAIRDQAVGIAQEETSRRLERRKHAQPVDLDVMFKPWSLIDPASIPRRPMTARRAWAIHVAPQITDAEWDEIVWHVHDTVNFAGSSISFFESMFDGLRLKDGFVVMS